MRRLAALLALLLAVPATAQDKPEWVGVWEGRVGTYPVRLCIDVWGDNSARGSYYYLSQLEPISLSEQDGEGGWIEHARGSEIEARWEFAELTGERMRGTWRQGRRSLPFELHPIDRSEGDWDGPCGSAEFLAPRMSGGAVVEKPAIFEGWAYTECSYRPPPHLSENVEVVTFTFPARQPGDGVINAALAAYLPHENISDDAYDCLAGAISAQGIDGYVGIALAPTMVSREYLAVEENSGNFCGGAHPNHWTVTRTFDRRTGEEVDLFDWLGAAWVYGEDSPLPDALLAEVLVRWPGEEAECRELATEANYWTLGLARDGLVFRPDFPHAMTACEEPVTVEWQALAPFLDAEGRAGLARLRGG